jgi:hypothetical protein
VQVSFLEGYRGKLVLDLVVFVKAHDVWTASVSDAGASGGAVLRTSDTSCTLPAVPAAGLAFTSAAYDGSSGGANDGGPYDISRVREGYFTLIAGGDIASGSATDVATSHGADGSAPDCDALDPGGYASDLLAPIGGIYGSGSIVNVGIGTYFAYNADALADFTRTQLFSNFGEPPNLGDANTGDGSETVESVVYNDDGRAVRLSHAFGIDAVSSVFMAAAIYNDYFVGSALGAHTDWVITFPTLSYYGGTQVGINYALASRDREEGGTDDCQDNLCIAHGLSTIVNTLAVTGGTLYLPGTPTGVFGSRLNQGTLAPYGDAGALKLYFDFTTAIFDLPPAPANQDLQALDADSNLVLIRGVALTGFMAYNIINANAQPGLLANYGGTFRHRASFACSGPAGECAQPVPTN